MSYYDKQFINQKECDVCKRTLLRSPQHGHWEHAHDRSKPCVVAVKVTPFMQVINEIVELHNKKQNDYGRTDIGDPFANVRASEDFNIPGWIGAVIRANDKVRRIQKFARGGELVNESVEDSLIDAAVYFMIALCLFREQNDS